MQLARAVALALALGGLALAQEKEDGFEPAPAGALRGRALVLLDGACSLEAPEGWAWLKQRAPSASHWVFQCRGPDVALFYTVSQTQVTGRGGRPFDVLLEQNVDSTLLGLRRDLEQRKLRVDALTAPPSAVPLGEEASRRLEGTARFGDQRVDLRGYLWIHGGRDHVLWTLVAAPCSDALQRTIEGVARSFRAPAVKAKEKE